MIQPQGLKLDSAITFAVRSDEMGEAFDALRVEWQALWDASDDATEAQTWEWQSLYRRHVVPRQPCGIAVGRAPDGRCLAITAVAVGRDRATALPKLTFLGEHDADSHHILHAPGMTETVGSSLLEALTTTRAFRVSRVELSNIVTGSWTETAVERFLAAPARRRWQSFRRRGETYAVPLPSTMTEYVKTFKERTSRSYREFERKRRNLLKDYRVELHVCRTVDDVDAVLPAIEAIDEARWEDRSRYRHEADRAFHRTLARTLAERGLYRAFLLMLDDRPAAYVAGFRVRNSFRVPTLAHDPRVPGRYSIGKILNVYAIEQCIAEGCGEYDLTRGSEQYKQWLGGELRPTMTAHIYRTRMARALESGAQVLVSTLRRWGLLRRLYRMLANTGPAVVEHPDTAHREVGTDPADSGRRPKTSHLFREGGEQRWIARE